MLSRMACVALLVLAQPAGGAQSPADPYLPKPSGLSESEIAGLRIDVVKLGAQIAELKKEYPNGSMRDRIADVEVYWSAVHNQIDQNLRTDLARAQRALQAGAERATQLAQGHAPWMDQNGVRGF